MPALSLSELAVLVDGQFAVEPDASVRVTGVAALADAGPEEATFFGNRRYLPALRASRAAVALVPRDFAEEIQTLVLRVDNPTFAFAKLLTHFAPEPVRYAPGIHPTAVIGAGVELGKDVSIQPYAVLEEGVVIGDATVVGAHCFLGRNAKLGADTLLHPRVVVGERCIVGDRVILHSGVVLGSDGFGFELVNGCHQKIPQIGIVQVDADVEIGANTTLDRARFGRTWIRRGTKIDNLVQIGHNVETGEHCLLVAQAGIAGSTRLGKYVVLGGQVGVAGHLEIGDQAMISAQSGVTKSLPGGAVYMGLPAIPVQEERKEKARIRRLQELMKRVERLEKVLGAATPESLT